MAEDTARAVGAKSPTTVKIGDKDCQIRPLTIAELGELERDCLSRYKREYLKTFTGNSDIIPNFDELLNKELREVAKWDVSDLPPKKAYDPTKIKVEKNLRKWLTEHMNLVLENENGSKLSKSEMESRVQVMAALALDSGDMAEEDYKILTGEVAKKTNVGYVNWWVTGSYDGMISMVHMCFRDNDVSREDIVKAIGDNPNLLTEASRGIEELSAPEVGNG